MNLMKRIIVYLKFALKGLVTSSSLRNLNGGTKSNKWYGYLHQSLCHRDLQICFQGFSFVKLSYSEIRMKLYHYHSSQIQWNYSKDICPISAILQIWTRSSGKGWAVQYYIWLIYLVTWPIQKSKVANFWRDSFSTTGGCRLGSPNNTGSPGFSDLPTALCIMV